MPTTTTPAHQPAAPRRPLVQVLTVPGCPNRDGAIAFIDRVREQLGSNAAVWVIDLVDQPAAEQARFLGSPTIGVDGRDIEPDTHRRDQYVHPCRLSQSEHGLRGLPDEDWLRQALLAAAARP